MNYGIKFLPILLSCLISNAHLNAADSKPLADRDFLNWVNENNPAYLLEPLRSDGFKALIRNAELEQLRKERVMLERIYFNRQAQNAIELAKSRATLKAPSPMTTSPLSITDRISPIVAASMQHERKKSKESTPQALMKARLKNNYNKKMLQAAIEEAKNQGNLAELDVIEEDQEDLQGMELDAHIKAIAASLKKANDKISSYAKCCIDLSKAESLLRRNLRDAFSGEIFDIESKEYQKYIAKNVSLKDVLIVLKTIIVKLKLMQSAFDLNRENCLNLDVEETEADIVEELNEMIAATATDYKLVSDKLNAAVTLISPAQVEL